MKIADLSRHRRVLLLCAGSAAVHLVLLAWFGARRDASVAPPPGDAALSVRLLPAGAAPAAAPLLLSKLPLSQPPLSAARARAPVSSAGANGATAASNPPTAVGGTRAAAGAGAEAAAAAGAGAGAGASAAVDAAVDAAAAAAAAAAANTIAASAASAQPVDAAGAEPAGAPLMQMPGRYRVRLPAPALLTYALTRTAAGGAPVPAGAARLDWRTDGDRYVLTVDGALGMLRSEGAGGDAGIVPRSARETRDGADLVTEFVPERRRVLFHANGADAPDNVGIQDRASLLMQLAGIGLGDPDQVKDAVDVVVAGTVDARVAHFRVVGIEDVTSGAGVLQAWHLAEAAAPGVARLDVWLAPASGWLPVQLRVTAADGASVTQTLTHAAPGADLAAPMPSR